MVGALDFLTHPKRINHLRVEGKGDPTVVHGPLIASHGILKISKERQVVLEPIVEDVLGLFWCGRPIEMFGVT